jgi:two-component system OmpR family sensor kinase
MSLRMRLILSFTLVVIICLSIAAVAVTVVLQSSRDRLSTARLSDVARPIYVQIAAAARGQESWRDVLATLEEQAQNNNVYIFLAGREGKIVNQIPHKEGSAQQLEELPTEKLPRSTAKPAQGTFETSDGKVFLYAAYYIGRIFDYQTPSRSVETFILAVPRSGTIAILAGLFGPFFRAGLVALFISVVIAFFLARSAYRPVGKVTEAVDKIAQGEYNQEIPVTGPKEIRSLATHFNEMARKVKQSQQQLRHFVADVSHQLRTPLTSIQGFAQAILDGTADDTDTRLKAAQVIDDESKRMIRQVEELLELSRMQSGQLQMAQEPVDIKELFMHCQEVFSMRAEEKSVLIRTEIEPLMPVMGDVDRLEQVFSNLLDNALKNTPTRGEVSITGRNNATGFVEITLSDNGPGIPPEQLPYVFERFYQASGLRTGFGLGLAIAKEIVTAHSGKIEVSSDPGEGTKFTVMLPPGHPAASG